jgi:hypothetical protein
MYNGSAEEKAVAGSMPLEKLKLCDSESLLISVYLSLNDENMCNAWLFSAVKMTT